MEGCDLQGIEDPPIVFQFWETSMIKPVQWLVRCWVIGLFVFAITGCDVIRFFQPTATPVPTDTPIPPTSTPPPSDTPPPTLTSTPQPTPTLTLMPTLRLPPTAALPTNTLSPDQVIKVYYVNLKEAGQFGCGEELWWLKTSQPISENVAEDIRYALHTILAYHGEFIGELYNPGYASSLSVGSVVQNTDASITVLLSGVYVPTGDYCDGLRFRDQLVQTARQFPGANSVHIFINGTSIGVAIQRK
jgi:hypothetical protein